MLSFQSRTKPKNLQQDLTKSKPNLIPRLTTTIKKAEQNTHKIISPGKTRASTTIIQGAEISNLAFEEPPRRLSKGTESLYKLSVSQKFEKPIGKPWTILEHKREDEDEIPPPSMSMATRTLDRYTFYQNGFSLFGSFQDSSKDLNDTKGSAVEDSMEKKNMTWSGAYYNPKPNRNEPKEGPRRESGTSKSNSIMKKISQIAIPQGNTVTKKKPKMLNEAKSERNGKPKMVESMWLSAHFADKSDQVEFSNSAVFISPKPQQPNPKIFRKSASLRQKTEEDSPSSMLKEYRNSKNPLIEPESEDYGKFNKLFRDVENRSSKKLDPERYQKIVNRADSSSNLGLISPKKSYVKQSSFTSGESRATKYFFGNKRPSEVFNNKKNTSKDFGTRVATTKHASYTYEAKKPKEYYLGN